MNSKAQAKTNKTLNCDISNEGGEQQQIQTINMGVPNYADF